MFSITDDGLKAARKGFLPMVRNTRDGGRLLTSLATQRIIFCSKASRVLMFATLSLTSTISLGSEEEGFVFSGTHVSNAADKKQYLRVGEKLSFSQLKRRFPLFSVSVVEGDCGGTCFRISNSKSSFEVAYGDSADHQFYMLSSEARTSFDILGNRVGTLLRKAVGARSTKCDDGMETWCYSTQIKGLSYIVDGKDGCLAPKGGSNVLVPECSTVGGFAISR